MVLLFFRKKYGDFNNCRSNYRINQIQCQLWVKNKKEQRCIFLMGKLEQNKMNCRIYFDTHKCSNILNQCKFKTNGYL